MASYHLHVKTFKRSSGQSATAAAAYRSGEKIVDTRTGEVHDYTRKGGVESSDLVLPDQAPQWAADREQLWNEAEASERRKNSVVAREFEISLPSELTPNQRRELALSLARELVARHGFAADVSIHKPSRDGDERNHHAHILVTTRRLGQEGFTEKTRELDDRLDRGPKEIEHWRERFATLQNQKLQEHGHKTWVDHRTLEAQGIDREPTQHRGPKATAIERKTKEPSRIRQEQARSTPTPQRHQEEPPNPTPAPETAPQKKENAIAAMRERAAQLRQKEAEPAPTPAQEPPKQPAVDKEQLRQQMKERAARLKQEQPPTQKAPEKAKPKDKDRGPER